MNKSILYYFCILLYFTATNHGFSQNYKTLSEDKKNDIRLSSHVLIDLDKHSLKDLKPILIKNDYVAIYISENNQVNVNFIKEYKKYNKNLIIISNNDIPSKYTERINIIKIKPHDIKRISLEQAILNDTILNTYRGIEELRTLKITKSALTNDSLFIKLWKHSGKLPNFIESDNLTFEEISEIVSKLNNKTKVFGIVKTEYDLLQDVTFENFDNRIVDGYFSFPVDSLERMPIFIPHKAGFYFSPDIIFTSPENQDNSKKFVGYPLDSEFDLAYHFVFNKIIKNTVSQSKDKFISNNVTIVDDTVQGKVGYFHDRSFIDIGLESREALKSSFSITAWIKPTALHKNNSIIGKGKYFVVKIHNGYLTFTMAGIKDYISTNSVIPLNTWTHISLVHSKINNELVFYINGEETDKVELIEEYFNSDKNLIIGSNLWEEFFIGYLNEVKIWERELNKSEIQSQYLSPFKAEPELSNLFLYGALIFLLIVFSFFILKSKLFKKHDSKPKGITKRKVVIKNKSDFLEQILCFGGLKIINHKEHDVAEKLSPKLKKLFIIIYLQSQKNDQGISTKRLTELLWPGMSVKAAKNTRGTSIQNLRAVLSDCLEVDLVFQDKFWFINISNQCYNEYEEASMLLNNLSSVNLNLSDLEKDLPYLLKLLKNGRILSNTSEAWLDPFIEKFSNQVVELCFGLTRSLSYIKHGKLLYEITEIISLYDDLNEKALQIKLQILIQQGKLSLAHNVYDNFTKLYLKIYKELYAISFESIISPNTSEK